MTLGACVDAERVALRPFPVGSARTLRRRMSMRVCRTRGHVAAVATAVLDAGRRARLRHDWRSSAPARSAAPRLDSTRTVGCRRILRRRPDRPWAVRGWGRSGLDLHALRGRNVAGSSAGPVIAGSRHAIVEAPQILVAPLHAQARQRRLAVGARGQTSRVGIRLFAGGGGARRTSATLRSGRTPGRRPCRWSGRAWRRCGVDRRRRNVPAPKRGADSARHRLVEMAALPVGTLVDRGLRRAIGTRRKQPHDREQSLHRLVPAFPSVPAV